MNDPLEKIGFYFASNLQIHCNNRKHSLQADEKVVKHELSK